MLIDVEAKKYEVGDKCQCESRGQSDETSFKVSTVF